MFSDRLGITKPKAILQVDAIDVDLRNGLWECCCEFYLKNFGESQYVGPTLSPILKDLYVNHFKRTSDNIDSYVVGEVSKLKLLFYQLKWYEIYNFIEFLSGSASRNIKAGQSGAILRPEAHDEQFRKRVDFFLEREKSGFRFVDGMVAPISSSMEVAAVSEAASIGDSFAGARSHIQQAVLLFSRKPAPDYRNTIKEAISGVESVVRVITGDPKATLGDGLKKLEEMKPLHTAFKQAMDKLYGYTRDEGGIRHSLIDLGKVDEADAKFMLLTCSAFINFCVQRVG